MASEIANGEQGYWMSNRYTSIRSLHRTLGLGGTISVVLDSGMHEEFSGIRLLIVCDWETCGFDKDSIPRSSLEVLIPPLQPPTLRNLHAHRRMLREDSRKLLLGHSSPSSSAATTNAPRPLMTVMFEFSVSRAATTLRLSLASSRCRTYSILHDLTYPCSANDRSLVAKFSSYPLPTTNSGGIYGNVNCSVRVLPKPSQRRTSPRIQDLPRAVLYSIVRHALGKREKGWLAELMNYGTVCRAWATVLDLFFEGMQSRQTMHRASGVSLVHTLEQCPDRRRLLRTFLPTAYREFWNNQTFSELSQVCVSVLGLSGPFIRNIHLPVVNTANFEQMTENLRRLDKVKKCHLMIPDIMRRPTLSARPYTMDDIHGIIANWSKLRIFCGAGWTPSTPQETPEPEPPVNHNLKELRLCGGEITGPQLLRFIPPTQPKLKELHLIDVTGISNQDLRTFLSRVASTLTTLHIQITRITRDSADEPYALDDVIPIMTRLKNVTLDGEYASALSIARRPPTSRIGTEAGAGAGAGEGQPDSPNTLRGSITIMYHDKNSFDVLDAQQVVNALATTGWKHIVVWWNRRMGWTKEEAWDDALFEKRVAELQAKGIHLRLRFFDRSLRLSPDSFMYRRGWCPIH